MFAMPGWGPDLAPQHLCKSQARRRMPTISLLLGMKQEVAWNLLAGAADALPQNGEPLRRHPVSTFDIHVHVRLCINVHTHR